MSFPNYIMLHIEIEIDRHSYIGICIDRVDLTYIQNFVQFYCRNNSYIQYNDYYKRYLKYVDFKGQQVVEYSQCVFDKMLSASNFIKSRNVKDFMYDFRFLVYTEIARLRDFPNAKNVSVC